MRKFFLFVLPAILCAEVTQANTTLWKFAVSGSFDSTQKTQQLSVISPEKVCEASQLRLQPNFSDSANTYLWTTPAGKQVAGIELIISKASITDAGNYSLKVITPSGEVQTIKTEVKVQALPTATILGNSSACEGTVYSMIANGHANVEYAWTTPAGNTVNSAQVKIEKLKLSDAGKYILNAFEKGCSNSFSFDLSVKRAPSVAMEGTTVVCENSSIVIKTKQDSAVKYVWWKGQNIIQQSSVFTISKASFNHAGKYLLQAKENGCINSAFFNLDVKPSFNIGIETKAELCAGESLHLKANDSGEGAVYNWSGPDFTGQNKEEVIHNATGINSGTYSLAVAKNGCSLSTSVVINVKAKAPVIISGNTSVCENSALKLWVENNGAYSWTLPNGFKQIGPMLSIDKITSADQGVYKLNSPAGTCADSNTVVVKVNAVPKPVIVGVKEICEGADLKLFAENATGNIVWKFANNEIYTGKEVKVRSAIRHSGLLKISIDDNGCSVTENVPVTVKQSPAVTISGIKEVCRFAPSFQMQAKEMNGVRGLGIFSGDIISKSGEVSTIKEGVFPIQYSFIGQNGCSITKTETVTIKRGIEVNAGGDIIKKGDEPVQINAIASDNYAKIEWTNMSSTEGNSLHPVVKPDFTTTYKVTVTNASGCSASDEVTVKVMKVKLANAFSPNSDGINDHFTFEGLREYPNALIQIFNAVGKQVFTARGVNTSWDGKVNGIPGEAGTYYYNINLNDGKQNAPVQGWIQLKR